MDTRTILVLAVFLSLATPALAADDALSLAANQAFLSDNAKKPGVMVRPDGLQYRVLHSGVGKRVGPRDTVQVQYRGNLIDGRVFDGSSPGLPASLAVGNVIHGFAEALQMMHEGDHWQIFLPANLGFGAAGAGTAIPPNQALVFDLTLVSIAPANAVGQDASGISLSAMNRQRSFTNTERGAVLTIPQ